MNTEEYVKFVFSKMVCSCCDEPFTDDSIEIIRVEDNMAIVKIVCTHCLKNYGIVIVGVEAFENAEDIDAENVQIPDLPPITTDDVIEAHKFINKLDGNWTKYIPEEFKKVQLEE